MIPTTLRWEKGTTWRRSTSWTRTGSSTKTAPAYQGLSRFDARKKVLEDLEKLGLLVKTEDHAHSVGHCYRCQTIIEPYLSKPVVRQDQAPGRRGHQGRGGRQDHLCTAELGKDLLRMDVQHQGLVHIPPALVGPPDPRILLRRLRPRNGDHRRIPSNAANAGQRRSARTRTCWTPGFHRPSGPSQPWDGPTKRRSSKNIIPPASSLPASTSSSSG